MLIEPIAERREDLSYRNSLPEVPNVNIRISRGQAAHRVRPVKSPIFLIGSARDCDLVLGSKEFPGVHSYLFLSAESVSLRFLGAGPELLVDGRPVRSANLAHGSLIQAEPYEFRIEISSPSEGGNECSVQQTTSAHSTATLAEVEKRGALEVAKLLEDIRTAVYPGTHGLRIYVEPDAGIDASSPEKNSSVHRASA